MLNALLDFRDDLEKLEALLYELSAYEGLLMTVGGLSSVLRNEDIKHAHDADAIFGEFSEKLAICVKIAPSVDKDIANNLKDLLTQTGIENLITQLGVRLKIEPRRKYPFSLRRSLFGPLYTPKPIPIFADKNMDLEGVIVYIKRLKSLLKLLSNEMVNRTQCDDEIFKPSYVDANIVVTHINLAIDNLVTSIAISFSDKERLISYLQETKLEIISSTPAWKKVVGALVICATIISGVADAPQAIENINMAIKHILGTSLERTLPARHPLNLKEDSDTIDPSLQIAST